jgi:hypothetical protein
MPLAFNHSLVHGADFGSETASAIKHIAVDSFSWIWHESIPLNSGNLCLAKLTSAARDFLAISEKMFRRRVTFRPRRFSLISQMPGDDPVGQKAQVGVGKAFLNEEGG